MTNHLIEGCLEAIKNWPNVAGSHIKEYDVFDQDYTDKLYTVLAHYQNGWDIFTRP